LEGQAAADRRFSAFERSCAGMAEILLIFPPDKTTAAHQLEAALGSAGYRAVLEPVVEPDGEAIARKTSGYAAALLIWSRPLAASADLGGWLPALRRLPGLIEVSTDGIAPQSGDERRVILLSGWRGQPFHLGWRRILEELESLGALRTAASRPPPPVERPAEEPAPARPPRETGAAARGRRLALPALAALALLGAVGGAAWLATGAGGPPPPSAPLPAGGAKIPAPSEPPPVAAAAREPSALSQSPVPPPEAAGPGPDEPLRTAPPPPVRVGPARTAQEARPPARSRSAAAAPLKRYSRKNSRTMRLFCARSGRSTPQCRIFARSTGADRR
jgi:hypothetical protein